MSVVHVVNGMPEGGEPDLGMLVIQADYDFPISFRGVVYNQFYRLVIRHVSSEDLYNLSRDLRICTMLDIDPQAFDVFHINPRHSNSRCLELLNDIQEVLKDPFTVRDTTGRNRGVWWVPTNIAE